MYILHILVGKRGKSRFNPLLSGIPSSRRSRILDTRATDISAEERTRVRSIEKLVRSPSVLERKHISLTDVGLIQSPLTALVDAREFL